MKNIKIEGKEYIELDLYIPVLLNPVHYKSLKKSFERYKASCEHDGCIYDSTLEDFANLCAISEMNIPSLIKFAEIISR